MAKPMKNYAEAGAHLTEMTKQQAEAFVKSLAKSGNIRRRGCRTTAAGDGEPWPLHDRPHERAGAK